GLCALRRIRPARATAPSDSLYLRNFSADAFLPRLPASEHVPCRCLVLRCRSCCAFGGFVYHVCPRRVFPETDRTIRSTIPLRLDSRLVPLNDPSDRYASKDCLFLPNDCCA